MPPPGTTNTHARSLLTFTAIAMTVAFCLGGAVAPAHAEDKKPVAKPKPKVVTSVSVFTFDGIDGESTYRDHTRQLTTLHGRLHVVVETTFAADGQVAERRLHANLMDAFSSEPVPGGGRPESVPATGSDGGVRPGTPCTTDGVCPSDTWTLTFHVPHGSFTLRIETRYDADGALTEVVALPPDGPPILG